MFSGDLHSHNCIFLEGLFVVQLSREQTPQLCWGLAGAFLWAASSSSGRTQPCNSYIVKELHLQVTVSRQAGSARWIGVLGKCPSCWKALQREEGCSLLPLLSSCLVLVLSKDSFHLFLLPPGWTDCCLSPQGLAHSEMSCVCTHVISSSLQSSEAEQRAVCLLQLHRVFLWQLASLEPLGSWGAGLPCLRAALWVQN